MQLILPPQASNNFSLDLGLATAWKILGLGLLVALVAAGRGLQTAELPATRSREAA
jgi:hypothetical protein